MRFIDFIIYSDFLFTEEKEFQKALSGFFKSNHLLPYLEAISRDSIVKEIVRELIKNDIKAYWEILKESTAVVACIQTQDIFSEMGHYKNHLEQSYLESSGNPKLVKITNDITRVFYKYGEERLKAEYDKATKYAFDFFIKGKLISFDEYINYIFYDQDSNDSKESKFTITTLQQFISYISFVKSIVYPFSTVQDITENKTKSLDLRQLCEKLCGEIDAYYQKAAILSDKLEKVMQKIYFYIEYHFGANQEAPPGHDPECSMVITTYSGIVSSWKGLLKFEKMKMQYEKLKREYDEFLLLMTNHDGSLSRENPLIKNFFQIISYWENNIPDIHKRRTAFNALRQFQIVPSGKSDYIYRNVSEAEYISILASKRFMQSSASSSEREKWFYFFGANLGSGVQHPVKCKISLKPGASELLKSLQVEDGSRAAIVKKVETGSELNCIGIHEDGLPLFNNLVNEVEFSLNGDKKATITNKKVSFARVNVSPYCVIDCFQEIVPLYVPRLYQSNIVEVSFQITQKDERKFEQWLDLNFQLDPLTRKIGSHPMLAYSYSLRLSLYGSTLLRQRPQKKQNTIELTTVCGQYIFDEIPSDKSRLSGICAISQNGNDITIEMFFMTLKEQINNKISQCIADPWMDTPVFFQLIGNSFIECLSKMATFSEDEQNKLREIQEYSSRVMAEVQQDLETNNPMVSSDELRQVQRSILATLHQLLNFLDFISVSGEVDENLLRAYLFTVKRHLVVICDNGDNPYSVSNEFPSIESQEWEKFFIVRRKNEGNDGIYFSELKLREFLTVEQYSPSAPEPNCK